MCFDPISMAVMAVTTISSIVAQKMSMDAQNNAAATQYNQQSRYAEQVNRAAIQQQQETDSRNHINALQQAASAQDKAKAAILQNQIAMGAARASAGTSGMMGLPLNMIEQNYESLIGGIGTNLQSEFSQLDANLFFSNKDTMLQAQSTSNQAVPMKPHLQKFGMMNMLSAGLQGVSAGLGTQAGLPAKQPKGGGLFGSPGGGMTGDFEPSAPSFGIA